MVSRVKRIILAVAAVFTLSAPALVPVAVYAQTDPIQEGVCGGVGLSTDSATTCATDTSGEERINSLITTIINIFSIIVGIVAVIMIIVGGLKYITSGGDSGNVSSAKNTIIYALVGLVIVAFAQFIVRFVLSRATGTAA